MSFTENFFFSKRRYSQSFFTPSFRAILLWLEYDSGVSLPGGLDSVYYSIYIFTREFLGYRVAFTPEYVVV